VQHVKRLKRFVFKNMVLKPMY